MTKQKFVEYVNRFITLTKLEDDVDAAMKEISPNFGGFHLELHELLILDLLREYSGDTKENDWISYWIYELECGKKYRKGTITDKDGKEIKLRTAEDLYELIQNESK